MFALLRLTGNAWFLLLLGATVGATALALASREVIVGLTLDARYEGRVAVGQSLSYAFRVANGGRRTSTPVTMLLHTDGLADLTVYVGALRSGEHAAFATPRLALQRGVKEHMRVDMFASPSLGLVRAHLVLGYDQHLVIHPQLLGVDRRASLAGRAAESAEVAARGAGTEPFGIREWQRGDEHRHVHWRSTARHGRLVVLERGETMEPAMRVLLIGPPTADGFEAALSTAAGLCDEDLRAGKSVTGAVWLGAGMALAPTGSRLELLDWWAALGDVEVPDAASFAAAAVAAFGAGELLVAGPPAALDDWLPRAGQACSPLVLRRLAVDA